MSQLVLLFVIHLEISAQNEVGVGSFVSGLGKSFSFQILLFTFSYSRHILSCPSHQRTMWPQAYNPNENKLKSNFLFFSGALVSVMKIISNNKNVH